MEPMKLQDQVYAIISNYENGAETFRARDIQMMLNLVEALNRSETDVQLYQGEVCRLNDWIGDRNMRLVKAEAENAQLRLLVYDPEADLTG